MTALLDHAVALAIGAGSVLACLLAVFLTRKSRQIPARQIKQHMDRIRKGEQARKGGAVHLSWDQRKKRLVVVIYEAPKHRLFRKPQSRWLGSEFPLDTLLAKIPTPTLRRYIQGRK